MFSYGSFMISGLPLNLLFKLIFMTGLRLGSSLFFCMWIFSFLSVIYWRHYPFPFCVLGVLIKISRLYIRGFLSGIFLLTHWTKSLVLCQYHSVLITNFITELEIRSCDVYGFAPLSEDCTSYPVSCNSIKF